MMNPKKVIDDNNVSPTFNTDYNKEIITNFKEIDKSLKLILNNVSNIHAKAKLKQIIESISNHILFSQISKIKCLNLLKNKINANFLKLCSVEKAPNDYQNRTIGEKEANFLYNTFEYLLVYELIDSNNNLNVHSNFDYSHDIQINNVNYEIKKIQENSNIFSVFLNKNTIEENIPLILIRPSDILLITNSSILKNTKKSYKSNNNRDKYLIDILQFKNKIISFKSVHSLSYFLIDNRYNNLKTV